MVLPPELEQQLNYELEEEKKKMPYVTSWERMAFAKGQQKLVLLLLTHKIGALDEEVKAHIVLKEGAKATPEELKKFLLERLAPYEAIARFVASGRARGPSSSQAARIASGSRGGVMPVVPPWYQPGYRR